VPDVGLRARSGGCVVSRPDLADRIEACLPAGSLELATFCRLIGIEESDEVPTAAILTDVRPRLVVNPAFVARHCVRDEHLYLLVMHELWHVLLAQRWVFPRTTLAENVAFDAIINAGLARRHPEPEFVEFFCRLNPPDRFPALLLRPPVGWPRQPVYPTDLGPPGTESVLRRLYPPSGAGLLPPPTYIEILDLIERADETGASAGPAGEAWSTHGSGAGGAAGLADPSATDGDGSPFGPGAPPVLLGNHQRPEDEAGALGDRLVGDAIRDAVGLWPPAGFGGDGRGPGGALTELDVDPSRPGEATRAAFGRLLRRLVHVPNRRARPERRREPEAVDAGRGVLPNPRDRLAAARRRLGLAPTLWQQVLPEPVRRYEPRRFIRAYLDVSGSMAPVIEHLCGLLAPYAARGDIEVLQFSTEVWRLTAADLRTGRLRSTGGTDGNCIWRDLANHPQVRRALVVTDGLVGPPDPDLARTLAKRRVRIHVVLPAESAHRRDLAPIAASITVLPPLFPNSRQYPRSHPVIASSSNSRGAWPRDNVGWRR
jgi:hypothetical protein